jgi:hypothetical protein
MAPKTPPLIPRTAKEAKKAGYKPVAKIKHADLSGAEKKKWAMVKAAAPQGGPHIVCYYDPNTGEYTDCHTVGGP